MTCRRRTASWDSWSTSSPCLEMLTVPFYLCVQCNDDDCVGVVNFKMLPLAKYFRVRQVVLETFLSHLELRKHLFQLPRWVTNYKFVFKDGMSREQAIAITGQTALSTILKAASRADQSNFIDIEEDNMLLNYLTSKEYYEIDLDLFIASPANTLSLTRKDVKRELEKADEGIIRILVMESLGVRVKLVSQPTKAELVELSELLYSLSIKKQIRDLERLQQVLNMFSWNGCSYAYLARYFGENSIEKCGHCQYCMTGSTLPVQVPRSTYELHEELVLLENSQKTPTSTSRIQEVMRIASPDRNTKACKLFGLEWYWHIHEIDTERYPFIISYPQGSVASAESRNYTAFTDIKEFKAKVDWTQNYNLFEVLLPNQCRHFFADLEWDGSQHADDQKVLTAFYNYLNTVFEETCDTSIDRSKIQTCSAHGVGERGPWKDVPKVSYHVRIAMDKVFANSLDFKKFYHYFHSRVCSPKTLQEEEWSKMLFYVKKGKSKPIYDLSITTSLQNFKMAYNSNKNSTRIMLPSETSSKDIEDHIVGAYHNTLGYWDLKHLNIGTDLPLGIVYQF
jgi:hypothetical protein